MENYFQGENNWTWGIDGHNGQLADMDQLGIWDPLTVRLQALKTAIETVHQWSFKNYQTMSTPIFRLKEFLKAIMILRIDDIVSGTKKRQGDESGGGMAGAMGAGAE